MDRLPDELVLQIAWYLEADCTSEQSSREASRGLGALARASKGYSLQPACNAVTFPSPGPLVFDFSDAPCFLQALPNILPAIQLGAFASLTSLRLIDTSLVDAFLPAVAGPQSPLRPQLKDLEIRRTQGAGEAFSQRELRADLVTPLFFLLDILSLNDPEDYTDVWLFQRYKHGLDFQPGPAEWDFIEEHEEEDQVEFEEVRKRAPDDFEAFRVVFTLEWGDNERFRLDDFPSRSTFTSLTTLAFPLLRIELFHLILHTSSFPSLRRLTFFRAIESWYPHRTDTVLMISPMSLNTLRLATLPGLTAANCDNQSRKTFYAVLAEFPPDFPIGGTWPPLDEEEEKRYIEQCGVYRGPKLDLLDCSALTLWVSA